VLRNTYMLLALSLIPTVIGAAIGTNIDMSFMRASPILSFFAILAIFYGWIYAIERNKTSAIGVMLLLGFTLFLGLLLGPLLQRVLGFKNGIELVMMAAGGTAAVFFVMGSIASNTERDFSGLGNFLTVGAVVILRAVVADGVRASPGRCLGVCGAGTG
jgi:modulator of FtsH protease